MQRTARGLVRKRRKRSDQPTEISEQRSDTVIRIGFGVFLIVGFGLFMWGLPSKRNPGPWHIHHFVGLGMIAFAALLGVILQPKAALSEAQIAAELEAKREAEHQRSLAALNHEAHKQLPAAEESLRFPSHAGSPFRDDLRPLEARLVRPPLLAKSKATMMPDDENKSEIDQGDRPNEPDILK
jgi:hypothetical protein